MTRDKRMTVKQRSVFSAAFSLPLILMAAYFSMGQTCCEATCPPGPEADPYPNHLSIDVPMLEIVDGENGDPEEPYFMTMLWEATSAAREEDGDEDGRTTVRVKRGDLPAPVRRDARMGEYVLLGEDISNAVFDFPEVPDNLFEAQGMKVKIAGMTMCGFELDDGDRRGSILAEFEDLAFQLELALDGFYSEQRFGSQATRDSFRRVATTLRSEASAAFNSLNQQEKDESRPLFDRINDQLDDVIKLIDQGIEGFQKKGPASAILGIVGGALKVIPNIVSLFRKRHKPDSDAFVGCSSIVYVGVPFEVWDAMDESNDSTCSLDQAGLEIAVCAIDEDAPVTLRLAEPWDVEESRHWKAEVQARRGFWRTSAAEGNPDNAATAHKYQVVSVEGASEVVNMPEARNRNICPNGSHSGECELHFAHMVSYQSHGDDFLGYEILEKPSKRYEINVSGENPYANVGVRFTTMTLPDYVRVKRDVIELEIIGNGETSEFSNYPSGYKSNSPNVVSIVEVLALEQDNRQLPQGIHLTIGDGSQLLKNKRLITLDGARKCAGFLGCPAIRATVRVTYLYWDDDELVDVYKAEVLSDDDEHTPPQEPERADMFWQTPYVSTHTGATMYYPTTLWSDGDRNAAFTLRATGTEVKDATRPDAWLYAQDYYAGAGAYMEAEIINVRFR
ncbi:MAG: hypothetical protein AAF500_16555 [Myxococcota bacterium]